MSARTFKRLSVKILNNTKPLIFLCMFAYIILQPHRFVVDNTQTNTEVVRAAYENLLEQVSSSTDWLIQFETLIVWENWEATINYTVAPGDTLNSIAQNFWTSAQAIIEANNINNPNSLRPWTILTITYDEWVMINAKETMTVENFANKYELNLEEFISMNFFENKEETIEEWWQIFVPLNQIEAEKRRLIDKEEFVMLDLPADAPEPVEEDSFVQEITEPTRVNPEIEQELASENDPAVNQRIISAQETQQHLEELKQQEIQAQQEAEQARIEAQQAEEKALEAERKAQQEQSQQQAEQRQREAEQARTEAQQAEEKALEAERKAQQEQEKAEQRAQEIQQAVEEQEIFTCRADQCAFNDQCWTKPANASCAVDDSNNAWTCNDGYEEKNGSCVKKQLRTISNAITPTNTNQILEQRYFNPHKVDSNVHGRWPGHCTAMVAYLWSQNFGIRIRDFWTGNAKDWLNNARRAWFTVNDVPAAWSLMVTGSWYGQWGPYGHVMYVESVNWDAGTVIVVDMNYKWRYIATKRVEAINAAGWFIHPQ